MSDTVLNALHAPSNYYDIIIRILFQYKIEIIIKRQEN